MPARGGSRGADLRPSCAPAGLFRSTPAAIPSSPAIPTGLAGKPVPSPRIGCARRSIGLHGLKRRGPGSRGWYSCATVAAAPIAASCRCRAIMKPPDAKGGLDGLSDARPSRAARVSVACRAARAEASAAGEAPRGGTRDRFSPAARRAGACGNDGAARKTLAAALRLSHGTERLLLLHLIRNPFPARSGGEAGAVRSGGGVNRDAVLVAVLLLASDGGDSREKSIPGGRLRRSSPAARRWTGGARRKGPAFPLVARLRNRCGNAAAGELPLGPSGRPVRAAGTSRPGSGAG